MIYLRISLLTLLTATVSFSSFAQSEEPQPSPNVEKEEGTDVSDAELKKFASVYQETRTLSQKTRQKMMTAVKDNGFTIKEYKKIQSKKKKGDSLSLSSTQEENLQKTQSALAEIQKNNQSQVKQAITSNGLTIKRYRSIMMAVRKDKKLQKKIKKMTEPENDPAVEGK